MFIIFTEYEEWSYLEIPARSRKTTEAQAIPNAAGIYEIVPTIEALFCSAFVAIIFCLSTGSGE